MALLPPFPQGPGHTKRTDFTSANFLADFLRGKYASGVPDFTMGFVDVRSVADAHVNAVLRPQVGRTLRRHSVVPLCAGIRPGRCDRVSCLVT